MPRAVSLGASLAPCSKAFSALPGTCGAGSHDHARESRGEPGRRGGRRWLWWARWRRGAVRTAGAYQVSLAKRVDGVTTSLGQPQRFEVYLLDSDENTGRPPAVIAFEEQARSCSAR